MTSKEFCYWLQGYFEISGKDKPGLTEQQRVCIERHLSMVFHHEIDPSYADGKKLDQIHWVINCVIGDVESNYLLHQAPDTEMTQRNIVDGITSLQPNKLRDLKWLDKMGNHFGLTFNQAVAKSLELGLPFRRKCENVYTYIKKAEDNYLQFDCDFRLEDLMATDWVVEAELVFMTFIDVPAGMKFVTEDGKECLKLTPVFHNAKLSDGSYVDIEPSAKVMII